MPATLNQLKAKPRTFDNPKMFLNEHKGIIAYLRDVNNVPFGVLVAFKENNDIQIGYSVTNLNSPDVFKRNRGIETAIYRARPQEHLENQLKANNTHKFMSNDEAKDAFKVKEQLPRVATRAAHEFLDRVKRFYNPDPNRKPRTKKSKTPK